MFKRTLSRVSYLCHNVKETKGYSNSNIIGFQILLVHTVSRLVNLHDS